MDVVIFDDELDPTQQRNIEQLLVTNPANMLCYLN